MQDLNIVLAVADALVLLLGLLSRPLDRAWLSSPLLAFLLGVRLSSHGRGLLNPARWTAPYRRIEETARLILAISLMAVALRLPRHYLRQRWRPVMILLGLATPAMFLICSLQAAPLGRLYTARRRQPEKRDPHESANHALQP